MTEMEFSSDLPAVQGTLDKSDSAACFSLADLKTELSRLWRARETGARFRHFNLVFYKLICSHYLLWSFAFSFIFQIGIDFILEKDKRELARDVVRRQYRTLVPWFKTALSDENSCDPRWVKQTGRAWMPALLLGLLWCPLVVICWMAQFYSTEMFRALRPEKPRTLARDCVLSLRQNRGSLKEPQAFFFSSAFPMAALTIYLLGLPAMISMGIYNDLGVDALVGYPSLHQYFDTLIPIIYMYIYGLGWCLSFLFFRSYFTFALNSRFMSTEYSIELYEDSVWQRSWDGWFISMVTLTSTSKTLRWADISRIYIDKFTDLPLSEKLNTVNHPGLRMLIRVMRHFLDLQEAIARKMRGDESHLYLHNSEDEIIDIRLNELTAEEKKQLFSALKSYAPSIHLTEDVQKELIGSTVLSDPRYTEIWFDLLGSELGRSNEELKPGDLIHKGKYEIVRELRSGGEAVVYLAIDNQGKQIALKRFQLVRSDSVSSLVDSAGAFEAESTLLSQLDNQHIINLLDFFVDGSSAYIALEYAEGQSLRELVKASGTMSQDEAIGIAQQLCDVLEYLHGMSPSVVHRDFTPDNIMVLEDGSVKLIDFSVAERREEGAAATNCAGKHAYTPPEQFRGKASPQSDIYALGGVLYYMLTGSDPTPLSQSSLPETNSSVEGLSEIIENATDIDISTRYPSVEWIREDLARVCEPRGAGGKEADADDGHKLNLEKRKEQLQA